MPRGPDPSRVGAEPAALEHSSSSPDRAAAAVRGARVDARQRPVATFEAGRRGLRRRQRQGSHVEAVARRHRLVVHDAADRLLPVCAMQNASSPKQEIGGASLSRDALRRSLAPRRRHTPRRPTRGACPRRHRGAAWRPRSRRRRRLTRPRGRTARTSSTSARARRPSSSRSYAALLVGFLVGRCARARVEPLFACFAVRRRRAARRPLAEEEAHARVRVVASRRWRAAQAAVAGCPACNQSRAARTPTDAAASSPK